MASSSERRHAPAPQDDPGADGGTKPSAGHLPLRCPRLIGRDTEVAALVDASAAPPALLVVQGEAGIGKTRLVTDVLSRPELAGHLRLVGRCHELTEPFTLGAVVGALRGIRSIPSPERLSPAAGALRRIVPELGAMLPPAPDLLGDPDADRHVLCRGVVELLGNLGPTVCVLEDVQWVDDGTADLLRILAAEPPAQLTIVLTCRTEEVGCRSPIAPVVAGRDAAPLVLGGLDARSVREMVAAMLETSRVSWELASFVHERTGGHPFAVEEVVRLITEQRDVLRPRWGWQQRRLEDMGVPRAVRDTVLLRANRLPADAQRMIRAAAVLGAPASAAVLTRMARFSATRGAAALSAALDAAALLETDTDRYGFRHALASRAVGEAIPRPARQQLHLRAAVVLEAAGEADAATLSRHYRQAGRPRDAVRWAELAAERAVSSLDYHAAARFLFDAMRIAEPDAVVKGRLAVKLGAAAVYGHLFESEIVDVLRDAADDDAVSDGQRADAGHFLGHLLVATGDVEGGRARWAASLECFGDRPMMQARVMLDLATTWSVLSSEDDHRRWLDHARELVERHGDAFARRFHLAVRAMLLICLGDPAGHELARQVTWEAGTADERRELLYATIGLANAHLRVGEHGRARVFLDDASRRAGELGYGAIRAGLDTTWLVLAWCMGEWEGLETRAVDHSEALATVPMLAGAGNLVRGNLALAQGRHRLAEQAYEAAARAASSVLVVTCAAAGKAEIRLREGDAAAAWTGATQALEVAERTGVWVGCGRLVLAAVEAGLASGHTDEAAALTRRFAAGLHGRRDPLGWAMLSSCRGMLALAAGRAARAAAAFARGSRALTALPFPYEAARAAERCGRALLTAGNRAPATRVLEHALRLYEELDATAPARCVNELVERTGAEPAGVPIRRGRPGYQGHLSPREKQVTDLARLGLTNAEIAERLFISPRTVGHHLGSALRKLGIPRRRVLARQWLRDAGMVT